MNIDTRLAELLLNKLVEARPDPDTFKRWHLEVTCARQPTFRLEAINPA